MGIDEMLSKLDKGDGWLKGKGIGTTKSRFSDILNLTRIIIDHQKRKKIWGQACKIAILSLFFACSFQNFISSQYPADGSLHQPPSNSCSITDQKEILDVRFQGW